MTAKDDRSLFRAAVRDVRPLKEKARAHVPGKTAAEVPLRPPADEHASLDEALDSREEESFLRAGMKRDVLRRLRRGHWGVQDEIDLHGLTSGEAREAVAAFLSQCLRRGVRCARIVHGKGLRSPNREPVLKAKLRGWLPKREEVLAFCEASAGDGGAGATLVLLRGR